MPDASSVIAQPNRFQWYCLTGLCLALLGAIFHPVTVVISVITHWYCRRNERLKIFIWGCGSFSLAWYAYYHPIYFLDPSQASSDFFLAIPLVTGMLQPLGAVHALLRPRSVEEWFMEAAKQRRTEKVKQLVAAEQIEKRLIPRKSGLIRLGVFLEGESFPPHSGISVCDQWLCLNTQLRAGHSLALGMTRSGKTETQKRYLFEAALNTNADIFLSVLRGIKPGDLITLKRSLYTFYEEFRYAMHPQGFSFGNSRCAIFSLPASSQKDSGRRFLDFLIEDFKDFTLRKDPQRQVILMVDELNALGSDNMSDLLKQCQSKNTTVFISIQDTSSLGKSGYIQDLLANIDVFYLLQSNFPELIAAIAGTQDSVEPTIQYDTGAATGLGSIRKQDQFRVHPNDVRELSTGEAFVIQGNKAARIKVARVKEEEMPVESLPPEAIPDLTEPQFVPASSAKTSSKSRPKPAAKAAASASAKPKKAPAQKPVKKDPNRQAISKRPLPISI